MRYLPEARDDARDLDRPSFARIYRGSALILHTIKAGKLEETARRRAPERRELAGRTLAHTPAESQFGPEGFFDSQAIQDRRFHRKSLVLLQDSRGLTKGPISVGRVHPCDVVVNDYSVSGMHAVFHYGEGGGQASIRDKGSRNGTRINGQRIPPEQPVPLTTGDTVRLGRVVMVYIDARDFWYYLRGELRNPRLDAAMKE